MTGLLAPQRFYVSQDYTTDFSSIMYSFHLVGEPCDTSLGTHVQRLFFIVVLLSTKSL